jgi:hypothetical protein
MKRFGLLGFEYHPILPLYLEKLAAANLTPTISIFQQVPDPHVFFGRRHPAYYSIEDFDGWNPHVFTFSSFWFVLFFSTCAGVVRPKLSNFSCFFFFLYFT